MYNILRRLILSKLFNAGFILCILTILSFVCDDYSKSQPAGSWIKLIPFEVFGSTFLTTMFVCITYEYWVRKENDKALHESLFSDHVIKNVLSHHVVELILKASLQRLLEDDDFGCDVFKIITNKDVISSDRRYQAITKIHLLPSSSQGEVSDYFYDLEITYEYDKIIIHDRSIFRCYSDDKLYQESFSDKKIEWRWSLLGSRLFQSFGADFYKLASFKIDGNPIDIKSNNVGSDIEYFVDIPDWCRDGVLHRVVYKVALKQPRFTHCLFADIREPTLNPKIFFDFSEIKDEISDISYFHSYTSPEKVDIDFSPTKKPTAYYISVNGWTIPKSGVAFVWKLKGENDLRFKEIKKNE